VLFELEKYLFFLINKNCANPVFDFLMPYITYLGGGEFLFFIAILILFLKKNGRKRTAILLLAGLTSTFYFTYFLKNAIARPRPFVLMAGVHQLAMEKSFSFPSTHAAQAFMAAVIFSCFFKGRALFFSIAFLVAFSRVYMGVHFVSDVVCGAIIGSLTGYILVRLSGSLGFGINKECAG